MERPLLFSALLALATASQAAVAPQQSTTLYTHMVEVNAQWSIQDPSRTVGNAVVSFTNEADRIAMHLRSVRERSLTNTPEGLSPKQTEQRLFLLSKLKDYADRGVFPQNHVLPYRNPVFIDPHGTACAVGQLMIESGHHELADRISATMNLAYVLDMQSTALWPEIGAWADEHGFTAEELAWIQPGYPPNLSWNALGGGTNGPVTVTHALSNGDLLVCGDFTEAGGVSASRVAIWSGTAYEALGTGVQGDITCAAELDGALYVGGSFLNGTTDLAKWNGSSWSFSTVFNGKYPHISALHVHNGDLYAAGEEVGIVGSTPLVKRLSDSNWDQLGSSFDDQVLAMASHDGALVVGGLFTTLQGPTPPSTQHVAYFDGTDWAQLGAGLDANVRDLLDVNGTLYAGGDLYNNIVVTFGMARIAPLALAWENVLPNHADYMPTSVPGDRITSLAARDTDIYFGGQFAIVQLMVYGNNMGRFNGTLDGVEPLIVVDQLVSDVALLGDQLIIGGAFEVTYPHIATLDVTTSVVDPAERVGFALAPNPTTDILRLTIGDMSAVNMTITITDLSGRVVATLSKGAAPTMAIDVRHLPAGSYVLRTDVGGEASAQRFIKQ